MDGRVSMKAKLVSAFIGIAIGLPLSLVGAKAQTRQWEQYRAIENPVVVQEYAIDVEENSKPINVSKKQPTLVVEKTRKYFDVPLDTELQDYIMDVCEEYHICSAIVVAMIEKESTYSADSIGDDGCSVGLLQVQEKWHKGRMEKLGVTDLLDPYENILVAVDYLAELAERNEDIMWCLMAYNGGTSYANNHMDSPTEYAIYITDRAMELEHSIQGEREGVDYE